MTTYYAAEFLFALSAYLASIVTTLALLLIGGVRIACDAMIAKAMESSVGGEPIAFTLLSLLLFIVLLSVRIVKRDSYDMEG